MDLEFTFNYDAQRPFETLSAANRELVDKWEKWGLSRKTMQLKAYRFDKPFKPFQAQDFILSLLRSPDFQSTFELGDGRGGSHLYPAVKASSVQFVPLDVRATSLDIFAPAEENDAIIRGDEGDVRRMMDVYLPDGITVSDQWRALFMLGDEAEYAGVLPETTKKELLYHVMWRIVAGGALNQWEDSITPYKDFARELYKDLVSVGRNAAGEVEVQSHAYQVISVNNGDVPLFPRENGDVDTRQSNFNFFYVVVNPTRREVVVWYNAFWSPF